MADIENRVDKLETRVTSLEQQVSNVSTKLDMFINESRAARERQDNEMREFRAKHDSDMKEMREDMRNLRTDLNNLGNYFRTTNITVIVGIAAMIIAVLLK
ncbi:MAG: hypothetical protein IJU91_00625 [Selenomonadaceae bacterium]|nr:hypothetical protein [Selenomonadaceae bacterium]